MTEQNQSTADDLERAACKVSLEFLPHFNVNHAVSGNVTIEQLDDAELKTVAFRSWLSNQPRGPWRMALTRFLEAAERCYREAREELATHKERDRRAAQSKQFARERLVADELALRLPRPGGIS